MHVRGFLIIRHCSSSWSGRTTCRLSIARGLSEAKVKDDLTFYAEGVFVGFVDAYNEYRKDEGPPKCPPPVPPKPAGGPPSSGGKTATPGSPLSQVARNFSELATDLDRITSSPRTLQNGTHSAGNTSSGANSHTFPRLSDSMRSV